MNSEMNTSVADLADTNSGDEPVKEKKPRTRAAKTSKKVLVPEGENAESIAQAKPAVKKTRAKKAAVATDAQPIDVQPIATQEMQKSAETDAVVVATDTPRKAARKTASKAKATQEQKDVPSARPRKAVPTSADKHSEDAPSVQEPRVQDTAVEAPVAAVASDQAVALTVADDVSSQPGHVHDNEREKTGQKRGRGLRAVVSRTRQKNIRNNQPQQAVSDEGGSAQPSARRTMHDAPRRGSHVGANAGTGRVGGNEANRRPVNELISFDDVVSGRFDDAGTNASLPFAPKRVLQPVPESPKLHKVLAQAGMGSRLEMEQLILEGRISVNGEPAHIGQRIQYGDQVRVNGKPIRVQIAPPPARVLAYHKPTGEIVTRNDPQNRPTVFKQLPKLSQGKWLSIGRLDLNTEGLLLFTNSGELANALTHPRFGVEREYAVRVLGGLSDEEKQKLLSGIELEDGTASFKNIENGGGDGANQWYRVVITEGRNREVRRMIESLGHAVSRLIRIRYGAVVLPARLRQGYWQELSERELGALSRLVGLKNLSAAEPAGDNRVRHAKNKSRQMPSGKPSGNQRHNNRQSNYPSRQDSNRSQPDPMKTSLGYIEHDRFITPVVTLNRNSRGTGPKNYAGNGVKRKKFR